MEHYVSTIQSHGTADGYNTELPERLHIDFTKVGYRKSSQHDYIIQMTRWITRQEKIEGFASSLHWCNPQVHDLDPGDGKEAFEDEGNLPQVHAEDAGEPLAEVEIHVGHTYHLAKCPGFPNTSLTTLTTQFHAPDFLSATTIFLNAIHRLFWNP